MHRAKWHKSCRSFYCNRELERASKRVRDEVPLIDTSSDLSDFASCKRVKYTRSMSTDGRKFSTVYTNSMCFICDNIACNDELHCVTTIELDHRVRECAEILGDDVLMAKLSDSDLIAQEAKYHTKCLTNLYNDKRAHERRQRRTFASDTDSADSIVFAQLTTYIEEQQLCNDVSPIFKLADLVKMYSERLSQLG
jgi:hypothetical protein